MTLRSSGSFELVLSPLLMGFLGFWLDRTFGTTPILTIVFSVLGLTGAILRTYFVYRFDMDNAARPNVDGSRARAGTP